MCRFISFEGLLPTWRTGRSEIAILMILAICLLKSLLPCHWLLRASLRSISNQSARSMASCHRFCVDFYKWSCGSESYCLIDKSTSRSSINHELRMRLASLHGFPTTWRIRG